MDSGCNDIFHSDVSNEEERFSFITTNNEIVAFSFSILINFCCYVCKICGTILEKSHHLQVSHRRVYWKRQALRGSERKEEERGFAGCGRNLFIQAVMYVMHPQVMYGGSHGDGYRPRAVA